MNAQKHYEERVRMRRRLWAGALLGVLGSACAVAPTQEPPASDSARPAIEPTLPRVDRSPDGMVVTGSAFATEAGALVLAEGGNAVDAAVAAAFVLGVVEPSMSGIGGRTQLLMRTADGRLVGIDGTTEVPAAYPGGTGSRGENTYGYEAIAIPGTVAALTEAAERFGRWPLARTLAPAIQLAEHGFIMPAAEAARIASVAGQLSEFQASRHYFLKPDGSPFLAGERFRQPDLAGTLRAIAAEGADAFYRGEVARTVAEDVSRNGGFLTVTDLAGYHAEEAIVVRGEYRGHTLVGTYLPASGATTIEILQILDHLDLSAYAGTARWAAVVAQALLLGFADRTAEVDPPQRKAEWLVSRGLAESRAREIRQSATGEPDAMQVHAAPWAYEPGHTTHLSVADRDGMVVALTQSVGPTMGSKVAARGLGFVYAATMGYLGNLKGGERPFSSQSPLLVLDGDQPRFVLGAAGARRIISAIVETVSRAVDQRLSLEEALASPRFHVSPSSVELETRTGTSWSDAEAAEMRSFGFQIRQRSDAPYFARINGIDYDAATREWVGVADSRWEGAASGPLRRAGASTPGPDLRHR